MIANPKNNNKHPKDQIDRLAKIIDFQGQRSPIVISNRSGFIVKGHARLSAIYKLGWEKAAVDYQDYITEAQEYADMTADNEIARWAELDSEKMLEDLKDIDLGDIDLLGMKDFVMDIPRTELDEELEDEVPEQALAVSKLGDLFQLGNHRLMCGDSTDKETVEKLMNGEKADMVFTDPPYGYKYESGYQSEHKMLMNDDKILDFMPMAMSSMSENSTIYVFGSHQTIDKWKPIFCDNFKYKNMIVWQKNNWSMGSLKDSFAGQYELILFGIKGKVEIIGKRDSDVWKFDREPPKDHPTMKPVELIEFGLSKFKSEKVLDLFGGSGSTLIACEKTNRKCFMMELDPHYCDVIIARWENYTGQKAVKISDVNNG
jgi:DNA modification methylase